jgi:hypothetical protein
LYSHQDTPSCNQRLLLKRLSLVLKIFFSFY